ncbi:MAG TPA: hypothetical protein VM097_01385 [Mycobacteriales bacterium]|nr:hypothetical protein [Mycobacteriales bacterium]
MAAVHGKTTEAKMLAQPDIRSGQGAADSVASLVGVGSADPVEVSAGSGTGVAVALFSEDGCEGLVVALSASPFSDFSAFGSAEPLSFATPAQ